MTNRRDALKILGGTLAATFISSERSKADEEPKPIRVGIIGLDTSHVSVFTKYLNRDNSNEPSIDGVKVVAAYPAGNPDFPLSINRVEGFTNEVRELGVTIVDSIDELLPLVDVVMLESVDGTQHLAQARPVFAAQKPMFIDKPLAASLADVLEIAALGKEFDTPWFTASSSRFTGGYPELRNNDEIGEILGCDTYSQARAAIGHPDLFWYGVHGVDLLYSLMGTGCRSVTAVQTEYTEQVTGTWDKGRVGTYRAIREHTGKTGLGATLFGTKGIAHVNNYYNYYPLMTAIVDFFRTKTSPVPEDEMVEVFAYMEAAEESKRQGGNPVAISAVMERARRRD
ncbi:MAG: Gfo/Idh/MocA family oxidoreductase [Planctomycetota bacterium]|nr:Gfo/Idh/MocA family oxidoreductase [Planctomycetota bacterium]MDA1211670.1 Gfo/Idh/MocA family oxidoreductase [Planctomycetota bacterium]